MATSSVLKNVRIKSKHDAKRLVRALEQSAARRDRGVILSQRVDEVPASKIQELFGK